MQVEDENDDEEELFKVSVKLSTSNLSLHTDLTYSSSVLLSSLSLLFTDE